VPPVTDKLYIKFDDPSPSQRSDKEKAKTRRIQKILQALLFFIPNGNPDYGPLMDDVTQWLVEFDPNDNVATREIGIDKNGRTLFITPWRKNVGLWTDEEIPFEYFKSEFKAVGIDKTVFEKRWDEFAKSNPE
jgi:hypothetical protein